MRTNICKTVQLGELVVAAFDRAAQCSSDPREVPLLATRAVEFFLWRVQKTWPRPGNGSGILTSSRERVRADDHAA